MPSRGTLQREVQAEQRTAWAGPTAPSGRRPPSAPRERKPALAALAILLIAGGALGAGYVVLQNGKRVEAIEVSSLIAAGQQIKSVDLTPVEVASNTNLGYVPWSEVQQVTKFFASTTLPVGTLLTQAMTTGNPSTLTGTEARVGLAVKDGQFVDQLQIGDHINIWADNSPGGCPTGRAGLLAHTATVMAVTNPPSGGTNLDIEAAIPATDQYQVTCNAAAGNVSVTIEPGSGAATSGGSTPTGGSPSTSASTNPATGGHSTRPTSHSTRPTSHPSSPTPKSSASTRAHKR
jgi:hypothetical protein